MVKFLNLLHWNIGDGRVTDARKEFPESCLGKVVAKWRESIGSVEASIPLIRDILQMVFVVFYKERIKNAGMHNSIFLMQQSIRCWMFFYVQNFGKSLLFILSKLLYRPFHCLFFIRYLKLILTGNLTKY